MLLLVALGYANYRGLVFFGASAATQQGAQGPNHYHK